MNPEHRHHERNHEHHRDYAHDSHHKKAEHHAHHKEPQAHHKPHMKTERKPGRKSKKQSTYLITGFVVLVAAVILFQVLTGDRAGPGDPEEVSSGEVAGTGDLVSVDYVGKLDDGTVFDTSIEQVAMEAGVYTEGRPYQALSFVAGTGQMIPGFDRAIIGMRVGETKTVSVPPEEAYGNIDPGRVQEVARSQTVNRSMVYDRFIDIPEAQFAAVFGADAVVDKVYSSKELPFSYRVASVENDTVSAGIEAAAGDTVEFPQIEWDVSVKEVTEDNVILWHEPEDGMAFESALGEAVVKVSDEELIITINAEKGEEVQSSLGRFKIIDVTEESIFIDQNHPLAGETLNFEITLVSRESRE